MLRYLQLLTQGTDAANSGTARHHRNREESGTTTEQASSHAHGLEDRLTSETHLRRFTETVLDSRQQEIEDREMEKDELILRVEALEKQLASTQQQLEETQDQVFRLQPSRKDITESEAKDAYKTLVGNVQRWVENRAGHIIDELETGRLTSRLVPPEGSRLVTLLREQSRRCINVSQSDEFQIMGAIMNYLHITMFSKSFYCPLDDNDDGGTAVWIDELENTMSGLQRDLQASVRRSIVEPAADLVHQLHLAPSIYSLKWPARSASTRLEVYQCFNLANGGTLLDLSGTKSSSPARRNVMYLFDIAPGLFVERIEEGRKLGLKAIVKPTVLVTNAGGDISQGPTVMRWLWDGIPSSQGSSRSTSRASSARRPAGSVVSSSGRSRY
ncbi:hypothetical protein FPOAC1_004812 [Fusarium poae]|uniref:hypothetical protein n=1 Tax=Fusarium poae TaxID=36050 RepID=UPI001CE747DA|nr:hypothetical protein FPOAC1_004812 [Fusarium poae]KAG8671561.1 hypothetical protein FPOAC1_004812 [Fusarium poae]